MKRKNKWPSHCWFSPPIYKLYVFVSLPDLPHLQTFEPNHCRQSFLKPGNPLYMASYSTSTRPQDNNLRYENGSTFKINWSITRGPKNLQNWYWYAKCDVQCVKNDLLLAMDDIRCLQVHLIWLLVAIVWEILILLNSKRKTDLICSHTAPVEGRHYLWNPSASAWLHSLLLEGSCDLTLWCYCRCFQQKTDNKGT